MPAKVGGDVLFALGYGGLKGSAAPAEGARCEGVVVAAVVGKVCALFDNNSTLPPAHQLLALMSAPDCTKNLHI